MKQTLKRLTSFTTALVLALSALMVWAPGQALAATRTWDGGGSDNKWSTAANWSDDTAPVNGDVVAIDVSLASTYEEELDNDINDLSIAGLSLVGAGADNKSFAITGNPLTITGDITSTSESGYLSIEIDVTLGADIEYVSNSILFGRDGNKTFDLQSHTLTVSSDSALLPRLKGSGSITATSDSGIGITGANNGYTGSITALGSLCVGADSLGSQSTVTMNGQGYLIVGTEGADANFAPSIVMNSSRNPAIFSSAGGCAGKGGGIPTKKTTTLTGALTLSRATIYSGYNDLKVTGTYTTNGHVLSVKDGSIGSVILPGGQTVEAEAKTTTIAAGDKQPSKYESIGNKQTFIIDGERGYVSVTQGGVVKGVGSVSSLVVEGGKVAPGHSPGGFTVREYLVLDQDSTYEVELKNKDEYDQLRVGESFSGATAVTLGNATLEGFISDGFNIAASDTFTIIDNRHSSAVDGTFKDLPEGATFQISDGVFKITYVGGDGNDVVLSVVTVPKTPSAGFFLRIASPYAVLTAAIAAAGAAFYLTRRYALARTKAKP